MIAETDKDTVVEQTAGRFGQEALLERVRLRAQRRVLWMRSRANRVPAENFSGLAISPADVERMLEDPVESAAKEEIFYQTDATARELGEQIRMADLEFSQDPTWKQLRQQFALSDFEMDLLALSVAAGADPSLLRVYAYLQDDSGACYPTPWLVG